MPHQIENMKKLFQKQQTFGNKNTINKMKNSLEGLNNTFKLTEE